MYYLAFISEMKVHVDLKICTLILWQLYLESPQTGKNPLSFTKWIYKQYNEILLIYKKEQTIVTNNHLDNSQKHCTKWKKPVSKCYILYDCIYMTLLKIPDYSDREQNVWQVERVWRVCRTVLYSDCGGGYINLSKC